MILFEDIKLAVIGLGYVGLPLAVEFAAVRKVVAFDVGLRRIDELRAGVDRTGEVTREDLAKASPNLRLTASVDDLGDCNVFIIAVPTPVDETNRPDMAFLRSASAMVAGAMKPGSIVIYESTVYPGATEEECVPVLEKGSGLKYLHSDSQESVGFYCGYSPERVNPGDKSRPLRNIVKITSGSTPAVADLVDRLYRQIIVAGTYQAESIKVAEAAKVIENVQRDVNIALVNELAIIFNHLGIETEAVLKAAGTKWNFQPYRPGLVGGHCIGIDPYYLKFKAQSVGYHPEIISAVRRLNDSMGSYVAVQLVKAMTKRGIKFEGAKILVLGLAFKENCPDLRNTRVVDIVQELRDYSCEVEVYDPLVSSEEAHAEYGLDLSDAPRMGAYDAVVIAVAHTEFRDMGAERIRALGKPNHIVYDLKYVLKSDESDLRL